MTNRGLLATELEEKLTFTRRLIRRARYELGAWVVLAFALLWLLERLRPLAELRRRRVPIELFYVLPVYALFIASSWAVEAPIRRAIIACAAGSALLIAVSGWGRPAKRRCEIVITGLILGAANVALFYIVLFRADLIDALRNTAAG
jgi:hypothetical protein